MRLTRLSSFAALSLAILSAFPHEANAQGGLLDDSRTRYDVITGTGEGGTRGPLLAIILWRGEPGWEQVTESERRRVDSVFRWTQLRASEAHLSFFGSGLAYGLVADDKHEVIIEGQHFPLRVGDSSLVVMVTIPPNGLPRIVASARIRAAAVPEDFWPKSWSSGDTTFFVHPRYPRDAAMLRRALAAIPMIADYLR